MELQKIGLHTNNIKVSPSRKAPDYNYISRDYCSFSGKTEKPEKKDSLIDIAKQKLLPGFQSRQLESFENIEPDKLVLVRLTDRLPVNGIIETDRDATKDKNGVSDFRDTVHFAFNHGVYEHTGGSWNDKKFAILSPFDKFMDITPKENIIGGLMTDFFVKGSVKIPEGSVIVRQSKDVPPGKLRIINAEQIDKFKNTKGIKLIETSENVRKTANELVEMMGYSRLDNMIKKFFEIEELHDVTTEEDFEKLEKEKPGLREELKRKIKDNQDELNRRAFEFDKLWSGFTNKHKFKNYIHTYSPYGRSEHLIEALGALVITGDSWVRKTKFGVKVDYQEEFIKIIDEIKQSLSKDETLTYDIDKFKEILNESKTPKEALKKLAKELHLKPVIKAEEPIKRDNYANDEDYQAALLEHYEHIDALVGIRQHTKEMFATKNNTELLRLLDKRYSQS